MLSSTKLLCKYGSQCPILARLVEDNTYRLDDIDHCSMNFHPGRRGGMTVENNFQSKKFKSAYQHCYRSRAHQCNLNFWAGKANNDDLEEEVKRNGYGYIWNSIFYDRVRQRMEHDRHRQMGSPLSNIQMSAVILYTNTILHEKLKEDERLFSMQDVTNGSLCTYTQKWPIFGRALNSAICCLNKHDYVNRPITVYHGLARIIIDPDELNNFDYGSRTKKNAFFKCGTFISTSRDRDVALSFACPDSDPANPSSIFEIHTMPNDNEDELIGADVSWISWHHVENEYLIARLAQFGIDDHSFDRQNNIYIVKLSVEFFCHRGQMCYSLEHDSGNCNCEIKTGRRPIWMPPPEIVSS
ncbi:unnamed protein product [Adineta ricciae]|uniref:NAD(+)--protein-arginine ADP-ribosyltransferase n=1 Tax=Adineta ricciae TaxID=249248 RepID=A0A814W1M1_ADIRI|nr:unnamed protein product [Adineta ricciae]